MHAGPQLKPDIRLIITYHSQCNHRRLLCQYPSDETQVDDEVTLEGGIGISIPADVLNRGLVDELSRSEHWTTAVDAFLIAPAAWEATKEIRQPRYRLESLQPVTSLGQPVYLQEMRPQM